MKVWKSTRGTTMVEVMVAFTVLVLIMGIFSRALSISGNMLARSEDMMVSNRRQVGDYYLDKAAFQEKNVTLTFTEKKGNSFQVKAILREYDHLSEDGSSSQTGKIYDVQPVSEAAEE